MIAFDLMCANGHTFEGWFDNMESFEKQDRENMINCPLCNNSDIKKILSPVAVKSSAKQDINRNINAIDYEKLAAEMVNYIQNEFEDIGPDFTKEALKIHYGASEARNIRGTASESEEKMLKDEGVPFIKFPVPKKDSENN